jgi:hypothetical protein
VSDQEGGNGTSGASVAFSELRELVLRVTEELATFRRRAHAAEARLRELEAIHASDPVPVGRIAEIERENAELKRRLEVATARTRELLDQVRFVRQQAAVEVER